MCGADIRHLGTCADKEQCDISGGRGHLNCACDTQRRPIDPTRQLVFVVSHARPQIQKFGEGGGGGQ